MRRLALLLSLLIATPAEAGTLTINYTGTSNGVNWNATATISDADAATFIAWAQAHYAGSAACTTIKGCFNTWANDLFNTMRMQVLQSLQATAVTNTMNSTAGITVTPVQ